MEWKTIRSAFIQARGKRTQAAIAKHGGISQSDVSKLESNDKLGPQVETFVKAVEGLGLTVSSFFERIEGRHGSGISGGSQPRPIAQGAPYDRAVPPIPDDVLSDAGANIVRSVLTEFERVAAAQRSEPASSPRRPHSRKGRSRASRKS